MIYINGFLHAGNTEPLLDWPLSSQHQNKDCVCVAGRRLLGDAWTGAMMKMTMKTKPALTPEERPLHRSSALRHQRPLEPSLRVTLCAVDFRMNFTGS